MARAGPSGLRVIGQAPGWGAALWGPRKGPLLFCQRGPAYPSLTVLSANMVLFSQGGRALGQARILLSIASPRWPWGSRTPASQAKSSWNLLYEAPGVVQAQGASDVRPSRSPHSSLAPPQPTLGREGEKTALSPQHGRPHTLHGTLAVGNFRAGEREEWGIP